MVSKCTIIFIENPAGLLGNDFPAHYFSAPGAILVSQLQKDQQKNVAFYGELS